jgi:hypothetical protein
MNSKRFLLPSTQRLAPCLVADVVTGKLDVREAAARLPDLPAESSPEPVVDEALEEIEAEVDEA